MISSYYIALFSYSVATKSEVVINIFKLVPTLALKTLKIVTKCRPNVIFVENLFFQILPFNWIGLRVKKRKKIPSVLEAWQKWAVKLIINYIREVFALSNIKDQWIWAKKSWYWNIIFTITGQKLIDWYFNILSNHPRKPVNYLSFMLTRYISSSQIGYCSVW